MLEGNKSCEPAPRCFVCVVGCAAMMGGEERGLLRRGFYRPSVVARGKVELARQAHFPSSAGQPPAVWVRRSRAGTWVPSLDLPAPASSRCVAFQGGKAPAARQGRVCRQPGRAHGVGTHARPFSASFRVAWGRGVGRGLVCICAPTALARGRRLPGPSCSSLQRAAACGAAVVGLTPPTRAARRKGRGRAGVTRDGSCGSGGLSLARGI